MKRIVFKDNYFSTQCIISILLGSGLIAQSAVALPIPGDSTNDPDTAAQTLTANSGKVNFSVTPIADTLSFQAKAVIASSDGNAPTPQNELRTTPKSVASEVTAAAPQADVTVSATDLPTSLPAVNTSAASLLPVDTESLLTQTPVVPAEPITPDVQPPDVQVPDVQVPKVEPPDVQVPDVQAPEVEPPDVDLPEVDPGRSTRSGPSYIGVGANFGILGGDDALGGVLGSDLSFLVFSKLGLTRFLSFRPAAAIDFDGGATVLLPITFDIAPQSTEGNAPLDIRRFAPYLGGGVAVNTSGDVGPLLSGGVDIPISRQFTATAGVNVGFLEPIDLGVFVGIGYTFPSLF